MKNLDIMDIMGGEVLALYEQMVRLGRHDLAHEIYREASLLHQQTGRRVHSEVELSEQEDERVASPATTELQVFERPVPVANLARMRVKFEAFAKACERLGVPTPRLNLIGSPYLEVVQVSDERSVPVEFQRVEIEAHVPMLSGGYRLVAAVSSVEGQAIVTRMRDATDVVLPTRIDPAACDYCRKRRVRHNTFFVWSEEKKILRQVGGDCVEDFLGHSPDKVLGFAHSFAELEEEMSRDEDVSYRSADVPLIQFLTLVAYLSEKNGFVTKSEAEESLYDGGYPKRATSQDAVDLYAASTESWPASEQHERAARSAVDWALALPGDAEFERNLKAIASASRIPLKFAGLAAYVVGGFLKAQSKRHRTLALKPTNERGFVGELEERQVFQGVLVSVKSYESQYGMTYYHTISVGGNEVLWKGNKSVEKATRVQTAEELAVYLGIRSEFLGQERAKRMSTERFTHYWDQEKARTVYLRHLSVGDTFFFLATVESHEMHTPQYGNDRASYPRTLVKRLQVLGDVRGKEAYGAPAGELSPSMRKTVSPTTLASFDEYKASQEALIMEQQSIVESIGRTREAR